MPFEGTFTQENYAQKMIDEYVEAGVEPSDVWPQSFNHLDVIYWVENTDFGGQAVALHEENSTESEFRALHSMLKENGVKIVAPPLWMLVEYDNSTELGIVPSAYSDSAKENGLAIITWTLERTPPGLDGWYWQTLENMTRTDGDNFALLHVLSQDVGVIGVFSDWPATTTFYANCMDLGLRQDGSGSTSEGDASAQASPAVGKQRHLSAASQFVNIALKLAGI
jgi:glycerophosphoryl diester phosphodiesterase